MWYLVPGTVFVPGGEKYSSLSGGTTSTSTRATPIAGCLRQWGLFYRCHGDNRKNKEWNMVIINAPNISLQEAFAPYRYDVTHTGQYSIKPQEFSRLQYLWYFDTNPT